MNILHILKDDDNTILVFHLSNYHLSEDKLFQLLLSAKIRNALHDNVSIIRQFGTS